MRRFRIWLARQILPNRAYVRKPQAIPEWAEELLGRWRREDAERSAAEGRRIKEQLYSPYRTGGGKENASVRYKGKAIDVPASEDEW